MKIQNHLGQEMEQRKFSINISAEYFIDVYQNIPFVFIGKHTKVIFKHHTAASIKVLEDLELLLADKFCLCSAKYFSDYF
jgi:hypothetical protein